MDELTRRMLALSPEKREWLEQRLHRSVSDGPIGKRRPSVIQLHGGGGELPLYFIYAGPDEISVAQKMGTERSIFGIEGPWPLAWRHAATNNEIAALPTLEQLVGPFVDALSTHLGTSPCVLAGHSFAGLMAFEAAHQLRRRGVEVRIVFLLDTFSMHCWHWFFWPSQAAWCKLQEVWRGASNGIETYRPSHSISFYLSDLWQISRWLLVQEAKAVGRVFKWLWSSFNFAMPTDRGELTVFIDEEGMPLRSSLVNRLYESAVKSYRFRSLDSRGIVFQTDYRSSGWGDLFAKGLEVIPVTGNHLTMVRDEQHCLLLARKMDEVLKRYDAN
jgi:pimeloyl-ACP methyl ester carboxylesterase